IDGGSRLAGDQRAVRRWALARDRGALVQHRRGGGLSRTSAVRSARAVLCGFDRRRSARARLGDPDRGAAGRVAPAGRSEDMSAIVLDIRDVHARYGKAEVLRGVTLQIRAGQWFCLLGPNGVGKSTLLHCVAARLAPTAGDISVCGHSVRTSTVEAK